MRKSYFLLIPLLIWGCEKTYDNLIDTSTENFQVSNVIFIDHSPPVVYDLKTPADSLLKLRINFTGESVVNKTFFDVYASDNSRLNSSPVEMQEVTENIFENQFILKRENPIGNYTVRFSASGLDGKNKQVAIGTFYFNNGQDNLPPEIFNSVIEPDTATVNDTTVIFTSVGAMDPNGANDIEEVYFVVYRPDGTTNNNKILLYDDGELEHGDKIAGDGIYSRLIVVDQTNDKGTYRFEFRAKDRSGELSNIINNFVLIR